MDVANRHARTIRLLEARLETLEREMLAAAAATRHAIELGLITREEAERIWAAGRLRVPLGDLADRAA